MFYLVIVVCVALLPMYFFGVLPCLILMYYVFVGLWVCNCIFLLLCFPSILEKGLVCGGCETGIQVCQNML
jgi:hypothetical protein